MLKWMFKPYFKQKNQLNGMWESQLPEFGFYYIERKMENVIRRGAFCNMHHQKKYPFVYYVQTIKRAIHEPLDLKPSSCAEL